MTTRKQAQKYIKALQQDINHAFYIRKYGTTYGRLCTVAICSSCPLQDEGCDDIFRIIEHGDNLSVQDAHKQLKLILRRLRRRAKKQ